ncbi:MAG: hypothetical protein KTR31_37605 [Myxococcales bacterium]|nr:hypothetical protein [Myxococcales bacterium]
MWWGVSLVARETTATYQGFPYQQQPPIPFDRFDGSFRWLREGPPERENSGVTEAWRLRVEALRGQGFRVPRVFERFMCDVDLWRRVPSCTANIFLVADEAELHPQPDGSAFLTFYTDSQSCVLWGLRLGRGDDRYAPVLAGAPEWVESVSAEPHLRFPELTFSAPTFEAFVYRWWIENSIWFATHLDDQRPLTDDEQAYVEHLRRVADVSG